VRNFLVDHSKKLQRLTRRRMTKKSHCKLNYWLTLSVTSVIIMSMDINRYMCARLDSHIYIVTGTLRELMNFINNLCIKIG